MDQAEPEDQNLPRHFAQRRADANLGGDVHVSVTGLYQVHEQARLGMQQILRLLQLNLFERRDLMALLRGDPPQPNLATSNTAAVRVMFMGQQ